MKKLTDIIELSFEENDFGGNYMDTNDCAIARALKRNEYEIDEGGVGGVTVGIQNIEYILSHEDNHRIIEIFKKRIPFSEFKIMLTKM